MKALKKLRKKQTTQRSHRTAPNHTDSRITLETIAKPRNHQSFVESIRKEIRILFSGMGAATIFGAKQVQDIYTIFDFFSLYYIILYYIILYYIILYYIISYIMVRHLSHNVQRHEQRRTQLGIVHQNAYS